MNSPTISIILPVYNCEAYLHRCIGAILGQTEQNLELILVDDGSTDSSGTICDRYAAEDARVRVIHKQNAGVSAARNAGLETAEGAFIAFADGDDWPEPEMYERLLEAQRRAGSDLIYCGFRRVYSDRTEEEAFPQSRVYTGEEIRELAADLFCSRMFGSVWRSLCARRLIGDCRFDEDAPYAEDLLFNLEILKNAGSVALIPDVLYNYNKSNENSVCARTEGNPDIRYTVCMQRLLELNEYWRIPIEPGKFYGVYVDMMFHYLVRKLEEGNNEKLVERYLTEGFFAGCCHYIQGIPLRRRIICILIRKRRFRAAVALRKTEDLVLKLLGR